MTIAIITAVVVVVFAVVGFAVYKNKKGERFKGGELILFYRLQN